MKQFYQGFLFGLWLVIMPAIGALGDKINLDLSTTNATVDGNTGELTNQWVRLSRPTSEIGLAHLDDVISSRSSTVLTANIPAQSGVKRYALKLYGKHRPEASTYSISIDNGGAVHHSTIADEGKPHQQLFATHVVTGSSHQVNIENTSGVTLAVDYFLIEEIPLPAVEYVSHVGEKVDKKFSGMIGAVSIANEVKLLGEETTLSLEGNEGGYFTLNRGELSFTVPINPLASYTVAIKVEHMGESVTQNVKVNVEGGSLNLRGSQDTKPSEKYFDLYDLKGKLLQSELSGSSWKSTFPKGMYILRWRSERGSVEQQVDVIW